MTVVAVVLCLMISSPAAAMNAQDLFDDGNRLFRDDLYWAALLRYKQASEAGMNTAPLHYNTGVAHYKAGQHNRARIACRCPAGQRQSVAVLHHGMGIGELRHYLLSVRRVDIGLST